MADKLRFKEATKHMQDNLQATASTVGVFVEAVAKLNTPVDTGHLRRSITHDTKVKKTKANVFVGTNVPYAAPVELGLGGQKAQPYIMPAIEENVSTIQSLIVDGLNVE